MQNLQELHFFPRGGIVDVRRGDGAHSQKLYSAPLLPSTTSTHQCCYLWWPTFEPCDWSMQPITVQSETSTWVVGQTPPIRGHRGSDRQTGQRVMLESQAFLSIHLRPTDTAVKLDTNTTTQGRNSERDQERVLFFCISLWIGGDLLCSLQITSYSNVISVL